MVQLLLFCYFDLRAFVTCHTAPHRVHPSMCGDWVGGVQTRDPRTKGGTLRSGSHQDSQAPCVVYHQISTPFPADEELVRIDV